MVIMSVEYDDNIVFFLFITFILYVLFVVYFIINILRYYLAVHTFLTEFLTLIVIPDIYLVYLPVI